MQARIEAHDQERRVHVITTVLCYSFFHSIVAKLTAPIMFPKVLENEKLREQLQSFLTQYEVRDKHFEHQLHAKDLEVQLADAKLRQSEELCNKAVERAELYR